MSKLYNNPLFKRYRVALAGLCAACVKLSFIKEKMENGEVVEEEEVFLLCDKIEHHKEKLLSAKEELGFDDGLSFMENNHFRGFEIKDGCVVGDSDLAFTILRPWYDGFPEGRKGVNNYEFEVANYLLSFLMEQERQSVPAVVAKPKLKLPKFKAILKKFSPNNMLAKWDAFKKALMCKLYS